ncbi:AAA family ATPase [Helicobacter cetorum]|uniref:Protein CR006 P-loop domain-containing protein n=1 Tax=Helicobacter cetorum (strain ATCC BAA-540 / CCUG 52418 / MIT 99-5656) TaxID=1163745 RepID=I0EU51_HELCM|nr:AAA family ATPase [Helicobacter cetorum]AFI06470.1 hypothetical protein HCD_07395 [Helicobacter cetorum MIT 99-5656]
MIKKIDIESFGSYENYKFPKDKEFKKINIIYGRNYAGKTTLSRIFQCLENKQLHKDYEKTQFCFTLDDKLQIDENTISENNVEICVYNTDFVKSNLSWLHTENGSIEPFIVLGDSNNELEKEIKSIEMAYGELQESLGEKQKEYSEQEHGLKASSDSLASKLTEQAKEIKDSGIYYLKSSHYDKRGLENDINKISEKELKDFFLEEDTINKNKQIAKEEVKKSIPIFSMPNLNFEQDCLKAQEILKKTIKLSEPIKELLEDSVLQEWVRQGRKYHEGKRELCAFCKNPIDKRLYEKLDLHFNKESEELREQFQKMIKDFENKQNKLDSLIDIKESDFYNELASDFCKCLEQYQNLNKGYKDTIQNFIVALTEREKDIFTPKEIPKIEISYKDLTTKSKVLENEINKLIEKNNQRTENFERERDGARDALRLDKVARFTQTIRYREETEKIKDMDSKKKSLGEEIKSLGEKSNILKAKQEKLKLELKNEDKGAGRVNEYLDRYFSHRGLRLYSVDKNGVEGIKYEVQREYRGEYKKAKNLSEGECSLISFCYFMAKHKDKFTNATSKTIIYIDDPISSLDNNHIFSVFGLIESCIVEEKCFKQLFISTHNLDFLRYLKQFVKKGAKTFLIENDSNRTSCLKLMPDYMAKYTTEFQYLFGELYKIYNNSNKEVNDENYSLYYNAGNNLRKFLECYLFYKYPNDDNFSKNLDKLFDNSPESGKINRFANELSHLTHIDRGQKPIDIPEIKDCIQAVMEKLQEKDKEQFEALKESVGVKERNTKDNKEKDKNKKHQ